jgi:hypothetical protein
MLVTPSHLDPTIPGRTRRKCDQNDNNGVRCESAIPTQELDEPASGRGPKRGSEF